VQDLIEQVRAFRRERDWEQYHAPKNLVIALVVEAAELAEHFQWLTQEQSRTLPPETLAEVRQEIGDVLIYLANLSDMLGIDPVKAAQEKLEINRRKYPVAKARGRADKSDRYE
jgi:NTP pyrophosphatase (non-canonical NTP hydrolase)